MLGEKWKSMCVSCTYVCVCTHARNYICPAYEIQRERGREMVKQIRRVCDNPREMHFYCHDMHSLLSFLYEIFSKRIISFFSLIFHLSYTLFHVLFDLLNLFNYSLIYLFSVLKHLLPHRRGEKYFPSWRSCPRKLFHSSFTPVLLIFFLFFFSLFSSHFFSPLFPFSFLPYYFLFHFVRSPFPSSRRKL